MEKHRIKKMQVSKLPGRSLTLNSDVSQLPPTKIEHRHSTSFAIPGLSGQVQASNSRHSTSSAIPGLSGQVQASNSRHSTSSAIPGLSGHVQASNSRHSTSSAIPGLSGQVQASNSRHSTSSAIPGLSGQVQASNSRHSTSSAIPGLSRQVQASNSRHSISSAIPGLSGQVQASNSRHSTSSAIPGLSGKVQASNSRQLPHSRSCAEYRNPLNIDNFPKWLEDNLKFSKQVEVPLKKSLRDWRCVRALSHIGQQKLSCIFSLQVHGIDGLPQSMDGFLLAVHWSRRDREEKTKAAPVYRGSAEFEQALHHSSTIYGSCKSPDQGMRYKPKIFTLFVDSLDGEGLDFGKHRLDLSKLLPDFLCGNRGNAKPDSWTTSFSLEGKAKGGTLTVTFRYKILGREPAGMRHKDNSHVEYVDFHDRVPKESFVFRVPNSTSRAPEIRAFAGQASTSTSEPGSNHDCTSHLNLDGPVNELPAKTSMRPRQSEDMKSGSLESLLDHKAKTSSFSSAKHLAESSGSCSKVSGKNEESFVGRLPNSIPRTQLIRTSVGRASTSISKTGIDHGYTSDLSLVDAVNETLTETTMHLRQSEDMKGASLESFDHAAKTSSFPSANHLAESSGSCSQAACKNEESFVIRHPNSIPRTPLICTSAGRVSTFISKPGGNHDYTSRLSLGDPVNEIPTKTSTQILLPEDMKGGSLKPLFNLEVKSSLFTSANYLSESSGTCSQAACKNEESFVCRLPNSSHRTLLIGTTAGQASTSIAESGANHDYTSRSSLDDPVNEFPTKTITQLQQSEDTMRGGLESLSDLEAKSSSFPSANHLAESSGSCSQTACKNEKSFVGILSNSTPRTLVIGASAGQASAFISEPGTNPDYSNHLGIDDIVDEVSTKTRMQLQQSEEMKGGSLESLFDLEAKRSSFPSAHHLSESGGSCSQAACKNEESFVGKLPNSTPRTPLICESPSQASTSIYDPGAYHDYAIHLSLDDPVNEIPTKTSMWLQQSEHMKGGNLKPLFDLEANTSSFSPANHLAKSSSSSSQVACKFEDKVGDNTRLTVVEKGMEMGCSDLSELPDCIQSFEVNSLRSSKEEGKIKIGTSVSQVPQSDIVHPGLEENIDDHISPMSCQHQKEGHNYLGRHCTNVEDLIEGAFLSMFNQDFMCSSPGIGSGSPKDCLLRPFERVPLLEVGSPETELCVPAVWNFAQTSRHSWDSDEYLKLVSLEEVAESELQKSTRTMHNRIRARMLEDSEAEELMQKWGLDLKAFQNSPQDPSGGLNGPLSFPVLRSVELPALAGGHGSVIRMKSGGSLRSMSPMLLDNSKSKGRLVMQVSKPLVMPTEMGSSVIDILHRLASPGVERLTMQARAMMPLEDITGKTIQQIALEARQLVGRDTRSDHRSDHLSINKRMAVSEGTIQMTVGTQGLQISGIEDSCIQFISLEELVPSAMEKIEALAIEGLKIQSDMAELDAPWCVNALWSGERSFVGLRGSKSGPLRLEGTAGLQSLDAKDCNDNVDGLLEMAITLDEWIQLNSGMDSEGTKERTSPILAAHTGVHSESIIRRHTKDDKVHIGIEKQGFRGNTLTVVLRVQLHDPLRNYEPVGAPMMALVQAKQIVLTPRFIIEKKVSDKVHDGIAEEMKDKKDVPSQFNVTDVHVAGLELQESTKLKSWSTPKQIWSGTRWVIANAMDKRPNQALSNLKRMPKSKPLSKTRVKHRDTLWSISTRVHCSGRWKELATLSSYIRNPNIIFPSQKNNL